MRCPTCLAVDSKVVDSRVAEDGAAIRRRRECLSCSARFTTYERVDEQPLTVAKTDGRTEPFDRGKIVAGVSSAAKGRSVDASVVAELAVAVEDEMRLAGGHVTTAQIGLAVLDRLRHVDEVAYLRFASVYKHFDAAADFHRELELLDKSAPADDGPS